MYNIYVTNKTEERDVYIRLEKEKISVNYEVFHQELDKIQESKGSVRLYLIRWGFCLLPRSTQPIAFPIDVPNDGQRKYASLFAANQLCVLDCEVNVLRYGCLFVCVSHDSTGFRAYHVKQTNPEPVWIPVTKHAEVPSNIIKVSPGIFLGRAGQLPCSASPIRNQFYHFTSLHFITDGTGEHHIKMKLLQDTGHEFVRAKAGDFVPPNGVITGVRQPEGSLFLGRVGGDTPCYITSEGDKIKSFCCGSQKFQSGEILILTH